jgi:uncharacterized protein
VSPHESVRLGRYADRGHYDFATIARIFDECTICYVGLVNDERPMVIPTIHGRIERTLYIHGSVLTRWLNVLGEAPPVCVTASIIDDIVLARSAFQHSMNYRSVVALGRAELVRDDVEKLAALKAVTEHVCPGRWADVRQPSVNELRATQVLRIPIDDASAKIRIGPPEDFPHDMDSGIWAGLVPLRIIRGKPQPDPQLESGIPVPTYLL